MEWIAAMLPLAAAAAGTAAFFRAGREPKDGNVNSAPPPSGGGLASGPETRQSAGERFFPEENRESPTLPIVPEWKRAAGPPSVARRSSLPIRTVATPPPAPTTPSSGVEPTPLTDSLLGVRPLGERPISELAPIWSSHWGSNSQATWLSGSDTAQLQLVSGKKGEPLAIAGGPASSPWWAPGHASLFRNSANTSSPRKASHRAPIEPNLGYLPPWARGA